MSEESVSQTWLLGLREGDSLSARRLWESYYEQLVRLARRKLEGRGRLVADEEDVALSALKSFCRGMARGRFEQIADTDSLWNLLVTITLHKVLHLVRDEGRKKRGGGQRRSAIDGDMTDAELIQELVSSEPTPQVATQLAEEAERLLGMLPSPELVELAQLKMEGYTNDEIAQRWQRTARTVERKLNLIRQIWSKQGDR
jgi:DNA-directed RNA polymerase specialized sigma24 family protein